MRPEKSVILLRPECNGTPSTWGNHSVHCLSITRISPLRGSGLRLLRELHGRTLVAFTSPRTLPLILEDAGPSLAGVILQRLRELPTAAIGPATRASLEKHGISAVVTPQVYDSRALARAVVEYAVNHKIERIVHPRSLQSLPDLEIHVRSKGLAFKAVPVYQHLPDAGSLARLSEVLRREEQSCLGITSPIIARAVCGVIFKKELERMVVGVMGGATRRAFEETCEAQPSALVVPPKNTVFALLDTLSKACGGEPA